VIAVAEALAVMEEQAAINPMMAAAIRLLMLTGCRKEEITDLRWQWVDFDRPVFACRILKPERRWCPRRCCLELLAGIKRTSPYVLPSSKTNGPIVGLQKAWASVRVKATELARQRARRPVSL
jgi:integrase